MKLLTMLMLIAAAFTAHAADQIYINVGEAGIKKSLLAMTPLQYFGTQGGNAQHIQAGQELFRVIYNDLAVSSFFTFIKPEAYLEDPNKFGLKPAPGTPNGFSFANWKPLGTEFLIRGGYQVSGSTLEFEVYVYHVPEAKLVLGKGYKGTVSSMRVVAHTFANDLIKALTGKKGMFTTKIVASRQEKGKNKDDKFAEKEIYIMDWDGNNPQKITSHQSIAISPAWSNKGDKIAYTAFAFHKAQKVRNADLFVFDIKTGKRFLVSYRKGLNSGAAFLPGDTSLLLTLTAEGSPDIYKMNVDGTGVVPLTKGPNRAMNVEPAVSPDGSQIAFSSDRSGRPMIYVMNMNGAGVRRLTMVGKYNASPAWSPDGKQLAFAGYDSDHFDIFVMNAKDGSNLRRLTDAKKPDGRPSNNESPSWSPDGRHIAFASDRTGKYQIYLVNPDGTNERRLTNDDHNWDKPKWSPYLD